jgi:hypothetical protein
MSEVIFLTAIKFPRSLLTRHGPKPEKLGPQVYVSGAQSDIWTVHSKDDRRGGCFRSRDAAFRFLLDEFGADARIVVQPRFRAPNNRSADGVDSSLSVAQRATAAQ